MFFSRNTKPFLTETENEKILDLIRREESSTSGEIRLFIESKCMYMDPLRRAKELFYALKMNLTDDRNAILIYIAHQDKDFALFGDGGIFKKAPISFWTEEAKRLNFHFYHKNYMDGILQCIKQVGNCLQTHFPFEGEKKNELPDDIIFGK